MMVRRVMASLVLALFAATTPALGQDKSQSKTKAKEPAKSADSASTSPETATVQRIMDRAVFNIARRYNLNDEQTAKTQEIMQREVMRFLKEHEDEVWPIIRELLTGPSLGKPPDDPEAVKRIGEKAGPLLAQIKEAVYRGNEEWRMYLAPEQKVTHDYDLTEMEKTFQRIGDSFGKWAQGTPPEESIFPPPPPPELDPPRPPKPSPGLPENPVIEVFDPHRLFDTFVEDFIKRYKLDEGQIDTARSILTETKSKAVDFRDANKSQLKRLGLAWRMAQENGDRKAWVAAEAARKELLAPVHKLFDEMEDRLMALLTTAQRDIHGPGSGAKPAARKSDTVRKQPSSEKKAKKADASSPPANSPKKD